MLKKLTAWLHRDCWRVWTNPKTGEKWLYLNDPLCPGMTPEVLKPGVPRPVLTPEMIAALPPELVARERERQEFEKRPRPIICSEGMRVQRLVEPKPPSREFAWS